MPRLVGHGVQQDTERAPMSDLLHVATDSRTVKSVGTQVTHTHQSPAPLKARAVPRG